jgi:hypothetical protein
MAKRKQPKLTADDIAWAAEWSARGGYPAYSQSQLERAARVLGWALRKLKRHKLLTTSRGSAK